MPCEITTEIEINASPKQVWRALVDFDNYPQWNPFIKKVEGKLRQNTRLSVVLHPPGSEIMELTPRIVTLQEEVCLVWQDHVLMPGLFDVEHRFEIEPVAIGRVRFIQSEQFSGLLSTLILKIVGKEIHAGFIAMNEALKIKVER